MSRVMFGAYTCLLIMIRLVCSRWRKPPPITNGGSISVNTSLLVLVLTLTMCCSASSNKKGGCDMANKKLKLVTQTIKDVEADVQPFTEEALALLFAERYAHELRFVSAWGKWLRWNG